MVEDESRKESSYAGSYDTYLQRLAVVLTFKKRLSDRCEFISGDVIRLYILAILILSA